MDEPLSSDLWPKGTMRPPPVDKLMACGLKPEAVRHEQATFAPCSFSIPQWGRPGFDSGYVVRASMQSGDERLLKTIITP